jgi:hypothetical protein
MPQFFNCGLSISELFFGQGRRGIRARFNEGGVSMGCILKDTDRRWERPIVRFTIDANLTNPQ